MVCYKIIDLKWKDVRQIISTKIWFNNLKIGCFTPMAREPRSTSTFTPGLSYIDSISFTLVFARKNYVMEISPKKIFFFKRTTVAQKLTFCSHTNSCLRIDDLPASCTFFLRWIVLKQSLEEEGGGGGRGGSWSRIPAPFSRETRIPLFFHRFSEFLFCFQKQQQQQPKKNIAHLFDSHLPYDFPNSQHTGKKSPISPKFSEFWWNLLPGKV